MFLKVSPMKGVMRFGKKGMLIPRYVGPFKILKRVDKMAYDLELPAELEVMPPVFHISLLYKMCRLSNLRSAIRECGCER